MPTRTVSLTKQHARYIDALVKSGEYQNVSEGIRDAVRAVQRRHRADQLKLKKLR